LESSVKEELGEGSSKKIRQSIQKYNTIRRNSPI